MKIGPARQSLHLVLAATVATLALASCSDVAPSPAPLGRRADAIQGGTVDPGSTFAVAVVDDKDDICSGTLIAPNLVLTARHCVASDDGGSFVDCTKDRFLPPVAASAVRVSTDTNGVTFAAAAFGATRIIVPTDTSFCGNDIALLVLDKLVPAGQATPAAPAIAPKLTDRTTYGPTLTAIGYGITSPSANDEGTRHKRASIAITCIPGDPAACDPADYAMTTAELAAGNGLCSGDSGSGAYEPKSLAAGAPIVMGVLSRATDDGGSCTDAIYTRTDTASALLVGAAKEAATLGGYPVPSWADPSGASQPDAGAADAGAGGPSASGSDDGGSPDPGQASPSDPVSDGCSLSRAPHPGSSRGGLLAGVLLVGSAVGASRRRRLASHRAPRS